MRKLIIISLTFFAFLFLISDSLIAYEREIKSLSSAMAEKIVRAGKKTIAVVDFVDLQGNVTELGRFLAEEFSGAFADAGKGFEVVDRTHLKRILAEHKLATTGLIDPQTAKKLGQIAGVDALITGTITPFGDSIRISVKVLDTGTAKVIGASSGDIAKTKAIEELLSRGIETGLPFSQQMAPTTESSYTPTSSKYKKIGPLNVKIEKIIASKGQISVYLEFANQSPDNEFRLGKDYQIGHPTLVDEKGNIFSYHNRSSGLPEAERSLNFTENWKNFGFTLPPKSANEMAIVFGYEKDTKLLGDFFSVNLKYKLHNGKDETISMYSISFTDIKAQKPK